MNVRSILAQKGRQIVRLSGDESLHQACQIMLEHKVGSAVVVDGQGALIGIFSERDVLYALAKRGQAAMVEKVRDLMTSNVQVCTEDEEVESLMKRMTEGRFRHLPVLASGQLVGVISIGDVVKNRIQAMESEVAAMRDYINQ